MVRLPEEEADRGGSDRNSDWDSWIDAEQESSANPVRGAIVSPVQTSKPIGMVETAFLASTSGLLWLINYYFPLGPFLHLGYSLPIALAYLRRGRRAAWMAALVASLLLSVLMGPTRSILFLMPFGFLGVLLGACWYRGISWYASIPLGTLLGSIGFFFRIWFTSFLLGEDLWIYTTIQVTKLLDWLFLRLGLLLQPDLRLVQLAAITLIIGNSVIYLLTVHIIAFLILPRLGNPIPDPPRWLQTLMDSE